MADKIGPTGCALTPALAGTASGHARTVPTRLPLLLLVATLTLGCGSRRDDRPGQAEATLRYLGHAGWLVQTREHCLIFDYRGSIEGGSLESGTLSPEVLAGQRVILFVSHAHGDHYKRHVLNLRETVDDLIVVMGWDEPDVGTVTVPRDGEWTDVAGAEVFALHHDFDGIPEGFFLVRSAGLVLYHSGDHGTWSDPPQGTFRTNIDRLAAATERIDIAFLSAFGTSDGKQPLNAGDAYTIETLAPRVTFPMHRGGREDDYAAFASEATRLELPTKVGVADAPGASFRYADGELQ